MTYIGKTKKNHPIGVFDSGVGGLSVLIELKKALPHENFIFLADQKYAPYGEKTRKELMKRSQKITNYFLKNYNVKMMVVACNTATANTVDALRKKYNLPIVGTIPAIKTAAKNTKSGIIAVLSTPSTSKSVALKNLIKDYCSNIKVFNIGSKNLANLVEQGKMDSLEVNNLLQEYLKAVVDSNTDYLVLGCTHYPFLKKPIQKIVGDRIRLIDSGKAIAEHTKYLLSASNTKNRQTKKGQTAYCTTGQAKKFEKVATILLKNTIKAETITL